MKKAKHKQSDQPLGNIPPFSNICACTHIYRYGWMYMASYRKIQRCSILPCLINIFVKTWQSTLNVCKKLRNIKLE